MTHFNHKEEQFKSILKDLDLGIDTESIWDEVVGRLPQKRDSDKLPFIIWLLSGFVICSFIYVTYAGLVIEQEQTLINTELIIEPESPIVFENTKAYEAAIDKVILEKNNEEDIAVAEVSNDQSIMKYVPSESVSRVSTSLSGNHSLPTNSPRYTHNIESAASKDLAAQNHTPINNQLALETENSSIDKPYLVAKKGLTGLLRLTLPEQTIKKERATPTLSLAMNQIEPIVHNNANKINLAYTLLSGPNLGLSSYSIPQAGAEPNSADTYVKRNSDQEVDLPGISSSFAVSLEFKKWRASLGIAHSFTAARYNRENISVESIERSFGSNPVSENTIYQQSERWHRFHNNIDLGLGIGRTLIQSSKYKVSIDLSSTLNIFSKSNGYYMNNYVYDITVPAAGEASVYKTSLGVGSAVSLNIERRLGAHCSFVFKPYYSKVFQPINNNINSYKLKNSQVGLLMGISYRPVWE